MKALMIAAVGALLVMSSAQAQSPTNSTVEGGQTAPANGQGAPSVAAPTGTLAPNSTATGTLQTPGDVAARQPTTQNSGSPIAKAP